MPTPENSRVVAGGKPVSTGTRKVAPNIATTCWAPMPMVRVQPSRSSGATTKSASARASTCFHVSGITMSILPGLAQFRGYQREWLRGDVLAGVTVAAYLVPQVMAYATVAGLPPVVGLWAALAPLAVYAVLGSSRQLSVGPESTTALMTATALAPLAAGDPGRYAALAAAVALLVGAICFVAGLVRIGFLADLLSRPVLVGYMTGVAVIMIGSQLGKVTGVSVEGDEFVDQMRSFIKGLDGVHWPTIALVGGGARRAAGARAGGAAATRSADRDPAGDGRRRGILAGPQRDSGDRRDPERLADTRVARYRSRGAFAHW